MDVKRKVKRESRKTLFGIKLPPIESGYKDNVKTVLDIDSEYFSLVEGRPIRPNISINKYKQNVKGIALKRILNGYLTDEILRIDRDIETEMVIFQTASKHFEECQDSFNKFLAYDNNKTIDIMRKSDAIAKDLANHTEDHKKANYDLASTRSKLQYIEETLQILLSFEYFLHKASPVLWRQKENVTLNALQKDFFLMDTNIFIKIDIDTIKDKLHSLKHPRLYFESPEQLLTIFDLLEKQNTNYLLLTEELTSEKNKFLKASHVLKESINQELGFIQEKITEIEEIIAWNVMREKEIKEIFFRILEEQMKYLTSSETVLQIHTYVEYSYENLIAPNDINLSSYDMISALKTEHDYLLLGLSTLDIDIVKSVEKETYESGLKEMKQAKEANKLLKNVDILSRRLKVSYEPLKPRNDAKHTG